MGVRRNAKKAFKYYKRATAFDNCVAQYALGLMYRYNNGVEHSYKSAIEWFMLAAKLRGSGQHIEDIYHLVGPAAEFDDAMFWYGTMISACTDDYNCSIYVFNQDMDMLFNMIKEFEEVNYHNNLIGSRKSIVILSPSPSSYRPTRGFMNQLRRL